jgi:hypothetical protein
LPAELLSLINMLITAAAAVVLAFCLEGIIVILWRCVVNRRYYRHQRARGAVMRRTWWGICGPKRRVAQPKFWGFPKSLVWPTPLFFACALFVTGLTRTSVRLLAVRPPGCGAVLAVADIEVCIWLPITVLAVLIGFIVITNASLLAFYLRHRNAIKWKTAARHESPSSVADPYMRLRAKSRVHTAGVTLLLKQRISSKQLPVSAREAKVHPVLSSYYNHDAKSTVPSPARRYDASVPKDARHGSRRTSVSLSEARKGWASVVFVTARVAHGACQRPTSRSLLGLSGCSLRLLPCTAHAQATPSTRSKATSSFV